MRGKIAPSLKIELVFRYNNPVYSSPMSYSVTTGGKKFACFLSHHKGACAMEARFMKEHLMRLTNKNVFLDSDDLKDLGKLTTHVTNSDTLVVMQSAEVYQRPWCLLEMYTAIEENVPIIAINMVWNRYVCF